MAIKKLSNGWTRDTSQEGFAVFRWYEKGDITATLVEGDVRGEAEWRISGNMGTIESRGDKKIRLRKSDSANIKVIESLIRREKFR